MIEHLQMNQQNLAQMKVLNAKLSKKMRDLQQALIASRSMLTEAEQEHDQVRRNVQSIESLLDKMEAEITEGLHT